MFCTFWSSCLADQSAFICTTGCALTEQSLKSYLAPLSLSPFPHPHTAQSGRAQRALQSPSHKKPKALTFVSKDDETPPLFCFASSGPLALPTRVLSSGQQVVLLQSSLRSRTLTLPLSPPFPTQPKVVDHRGHCKVQAIRSPRP